MSRALIATFAAFHASQNGSAPPVLAMSDAEALATVDELTPSDVRHPEVLLEAHAALKAVPAPPDPRNEDALAAWFDAKSKASAAFWNAFHGELVDGVTIIRKRL